MLYPRVSYSEASPKAISRRTSYLRVRLEFHRYPQVILTLFNGYKFGPPRDFTLASTCSWIGHPVSGLQHVTCRPIQTRFPSGSGALHLNLATYHNSLARSTKSTWSLALPLLVSTGFQVLFHSPPGVLFTFPSRYYFAIGHRLVFRLGGWAPRLHAKFLVLGATLVLSGLKLHFVYGAFTLFGVSFQTSSTMHLFRSLTVRNPDSKLPVWPLSRSLAAT